MRALFKPLPTTSDGLYSFHHLQRQICKVSTAARLESLASSGIIKTLLHRVELEEGLIL